LDDLFPFAHYSLIQTPDDILGYQVPIELSNTVYEGADGIYFNGLHAFDPGGSYARTSAMSALYDAAFAVQVEFKIEDLDGEYRAVIVCGEGWRYLGLLIRLDSFALVVNNNEFTFITTVLPEEDVWYKVTILCDTVTDNIQLFLDGMQLADFNEELIRPAGDNVVANYHAGGGYPLKGNWRNLRIYGSQDISALKDELYAERNLKLFPNPATNELHFECLFLKATHWSIASMNGELLNGGNVAEQENIVTLDQLAAGVYYLQVMDEFKKPLCSRSFSKFCP
jgi:hypothetical protein